MEKGVYKQQRKKETLWKSSRLNQNKFSAAKNKKEAPAKKTYKEETTSQDTGTLKVVGAGNQRIRKHNQAEQMPNHPKVLPT